MSDHEDETDEVSSDILATRHAHVDPSAMLRDLTDLANELHRVVSRLSPHILNGSERKENILSIIQKVSSPTPAKSKIDLPADVAPPSYLPRVSAGIIGGTGSGKSTLLQALIGEKVSPTSSNGRGTAFPTMIMYHGHDYYKASLTFMALEHARTLVESAFDVIKPDENGRSMSLTDLQKDPSYAFVKEAFGADKRDLQLIVDNNANEEEDKHAERFLQQFPDIMELLGNTIHIQENERNVFETRLKPYLGSQNRNHVKGPKKWAILSRSLVCCRAKGLSKNALIVDMPGHGDHSTTVLRVTADMESKLDVKFVAVPPVRATNDRGVNDYMGEEIARRRNTNLDQETSASSSRLAVILTQCDALDDKSVCKLEADSDVGPVLDDDMEFQALSAKIVEAMSQLEEKQSDLKSLRELEDRIGPDGHEDASIDHTVIGSGAVKRGSQRGSHPPKAKRIRLDTSGDSLSTDIHESADDKESDILATLVDVRARRKQAEADVEALKTTVDQSCSQRRLWAWNTKYSLIASDLRRLFEHKLHETTRDTDGDINMEGGPKNTPLPVFATAADDFNNLKDNIELEQQTGIPALRKFIYHIGARAENQAILDLLQNFRMALQSTVTSLNAAGRESMGEKALHQKEAFKTRWASPSSVSDPKAQTTTTVEPGPSSTAAETPPKGIRVELSAMFEQKVRARIEVARADLKVLETACEKGAEDAISAARVKAQSLVDQKEHWGKHRAAMKNRGIYGTLGNYNDTLAEPLVNAVKQALRTYSSQKIFGGLKPVLVKTADDLLRQVHESTVGYEHDVIQGVQAATTRWRSRLDSEIRILAGIVDSVIKETDYLPLSSTDFFSDAVMDHLRSTYSEAASFRGRGSVERMKVHFVDAVNSNSADMFHEMTKTFIGRHAKLLDRLEFKILKRLRRLSEKCEMEVSNAWFIPASNRYQLRHRAEAVKDVDAIERRLEKLETDLVNDMEESERDVPTCYPPCGPPIGLI
ncbi:unnamed protein product [Peniophora sp. CBMAI 1063]|nr:unnamed protein product [Peniophora sp. CBMAI 1063]